MEVRQLSPRQLAISRSEKVYFSKPCKSCATTLKYVRNGGCIECQNARNRINYKATDPKIKQNYQLQWKYGITIEQYESMLADQNYACAVCNIKEPRTFVVDHCHTTGKVRSILCNCCNLIIGMVKEDVTVLEQLSKYIKEICL